jgi:hypothetical protein
VENGHDRDGLGSEENYFWKTAKERSNFDINVEADPNIGVGNTANYEFTVEDAPELG